MGGLKQSIKELGSLLAGFVGLPLHEVLDGRDSGKKWSTLHPILLRVGDVLVLQDRKPATLDVLVRLCLDRGVVVNLIKLLVVQQQWQQDVPSTAPNLHEALRMFRLGASLLLGSMVDIAADNSEGYPQTANQMMSAIQYQGQAEPGADDLDRSCSNIILVSHSTVSTPACEGHCLIP